MSQTLFLLYRPEPARPMLKARSVGAHSICARGSLSCRKRARADMESAPTFFVAGGGPPAEGGAPRGVFSLWSKTKSVGAHSICARGSLSYRKRARADMESAPTFFCSGAPAPRGPRGAFLPVVRASGFISAFALSKTILCGILFLYKSTGKPGANRRRKAIGAHRVSQLPTRNCCFTAAGSFASFWGQELTRVKTHQYTGGTKQGIYDALLFSAARGYCLIRSDSAFRHGFAMP